MVPPSHLTAPGEPVLRLCDASIGYGGRPIIDAIDLTVTRGEVLAVLGPNGSGKSTLVRGILGLADHLRGEMQLFGCPVEHLHERWRIGYVPQRHTLAGGLPVTVGEIVASGRLARIKPWKRAGAEDRARIAEAIDLVALGGLERTPVTTLSGGQQRRALIARALAAEAELLLLDEPTAGVDSASQQVLADTLAKLVAAGATIVLVTHELGPVARLVTRVVEMRAGAVVYDGPPAGSTLHGYGIDHAVHAPAADPVRAG